jgi:hypothetical protein
MASKFLTNIDLNGNQVINATFEVLGLAPTTNLFDGRMYFDSASGVIRIYDATASAWRKVVAGYEETAGVISGGTHSAALTITESNGQITVTPSLATSSNAGLLSSTFYDDLNTATSDATASKLAKRDANGNIKVATPTDAAHAATKGYVDSARQGLDVKQSVRAATTGPVTLATDLEAGDTLDTTVTLVAGNRILVKNQATASQNGIYVVQATGAPVRAADANGTADTGEVSGGTFVFVEEGTLNADSGFVVSSNGTIAVGTDPMNWVQFSGAGAFTAGDGLTQDGTTINAVGTTDRIAVSANAIDISANYVGQSSITTLGTITAGTWNGTDIAVTDGGTGASTAADARTNLGIKTTSGAVTTSTSVLARTAHQACAASSGPTSVTTVTHNFNTKNVIVQVYQVSTGETVTTDVVRGTVDSLTVTINGSTIASDDYHIVVTG